MNIFAINKPQGPSSHDIINQIRKKTGVKKVGHAGTLDPLASGVLIVAVGREATKNLATFVKKEKEYEAEIKFGFFSTTDDTEGEKEKVDFFQKPSLSDIKKILPEFTGEIEQTPPLYSAIKIKGREAYKYARKGQKIELKPRKVMVKKITILDYQWPVLKIRFITGSGVYIRSLARDIGKKLGVGGYLQKLTRTRVGEFSLEKCIEVENIRI